MKKISIIFALIVALGVGAGVYSQTAPTSVTKPNQSAYAVQYTQVNALDVVASPFKYLHRNIKIRAKFDKFSTLGLDYPPAMRASDKYISILIQRPDVADHNIPLSEMKIFLKKDLAEKNISLDVGDEIEFTGRVFSTALGDAWMDVDSLKIISKKNPTKKEENVIE